MYTKTQTSRLNIAITGLLLLLIFLIPSVVHAEDTVLLGRVYSQSTVGYSGCRGSRFIYGNACGSNTTAGCNGLDYSVTWRQGTNSRTISDNSCWDSMPRYTFENTAKPQGDYNGEWVTVELAITGGRRCTTWTMETTNSGGGLYSGSGQSGNISYNTTTGLNSLSLLVYRNNDYKWNHLMFWGCCNNKCGTCITCPCTAPQDVTLVQAIPLSPLADSQLYPALYDTEDNPELVARQLEMNPPDFGLEAAYASTGCCDNCSNLVPAAYADNTDSTSSLSPQKSLLASLISTRSLLLLVMVTINIVLMLALRRFWFTKIQS